MAALHHPNTRPWWRKIDIALARQEAALLSEHSELIYFRFLLAYAEHRCALPADPRALAKVLGTTERRAADFLREAAHFLGTDDNGQIIHQSSRDDLQKAVRESLSQAKRRSMREVANG